METELHLSSADLQSIRQHLFGKLGPNEEAAFLFVRSECNNSKQDLKVVEWAAVPATGFVSRTPWYIELSDSTRATR